jgi:N-acetylmuramoyl-L-alanine amidase
VKELKTATKLHKAPLKSASFRVLKAPDVPSALVELGYVTNRQDIKSLTSEVWRERTASSMMRAIETFFATRTAGTAGSLQ